MRPGELFEVAQRYVDDNLDGAPIPGEVRLDIDPDLCADIGRAYDAAVDRLDDLAVLARYEAFKTETARQFEALRAAGLVIRPWLTDGQPYASSQELREQVVATSTLYVFLTRCGHGPCSEVNEAHPMCAPSGVSVDDEPLLYNDLFRAVHDAFGHIMRGNDFSTAGEFMATHDHLHMYSDAARPAVFSETIGQICWFYHGPHVLGTDGRPLRPGDPGYLSPGERPYPQQKVFLLGDDLLARYEGLFERKAA